MGLDRHYPWIFGHASLALMPKSVWMGARKMRTLVLVAIAIYFASELPIDLALILAQASKNRASKDNNVAR